MADETRNTVESMDSIKIPMANLDFTTTDSLKKVPELNSSDCDSDR